MGALLHFMGSFQQGTNILHFILWLVLPCHIYMESRMLRVGFSDLLSGHQPPGASFADMY